jgi:hypothetical protein
MTSTIVVSASTTPPAVNSDTSPKLSGAGDSFSSAR